MNATLQLYIRIGMCVLVLGWIPQLLSAQDHSRMLHGTVLTESAEPLIGATLQWPDGTGSVTDMDGRFMLDLPEKKQVLSISFIGYTTVTLDIGPHDKDDLRIIMVEGKTLRTVEIAGRKKGSTTSTLETRNIESINSVELRKAPCCSLAESFETNPTVDLNYPDPLTGSREIQVLGLNSKYTLFTLEKRPTFQGLAGSKGMDFIPGTWLEGIQIGKGAGSVQSAGGGLNGEINAELEKPFRGPAMFVNLFGANTGRMEANVHFNRQLSDRWSSGLLLHGSRLKRNIDRDEDSFNDQPDRQTTVGLFRLMQNGAPGWEGQFNVMAGIDERTGGQVYSTETVSGPLYQIRQRNEHLSLFGKTGIFAFPQPYKSMGAIWSWRHHKLDNFYGRKAHTGVQNTGYANIMYRTIIGTTDHQITVGASGQLMDIDERLGEQVLDRRESTGGLHAEYQWSRTRLDEGNGPQQVDLQLGLRLDHHSELGLQWVPRINMKVNFTEQNALRLSAGRAYRSPHILTENLRWLPSSRTVVVQPGVLRESGWNLGMHFSQHFHLIGKEASLNLDAYRTTFDDQVIMDVDQDADNLYFYQLNGKSYANSLMATLSYQISQQLELKLAYRWNDIKTTYQQKGLREMPLTPRSRALVVADYTARRWRVNATWQWNGRQRLPDHDVLPASVVVTAPQVAPDYQIVNVQVTWIANDRMEWYGGVENITNVRQQQAIIGADAPFDGPYFDAAQVYQPLFGRQLNLGMRYTLDQ